MQIGLGRCWCCVITPKANIPYTADAILTQNCFSETLEQVDQRCDGCPIPGDTQGQAEWGSEHLCPCSPCPRHKHDIEEK